MTGFVFGLVPWVVPMSIMLCDWVVCRSKTSRFVCPLCQPRPYPHCSPRRGRRPVFRSYSGFGLSETFQELSSEKLLFRLVVGQVSIGPSSTHWRTRRRDSVRPHVWTVDQDRRSVTLRGLTPRERLSSGPTRPPLRPQRRHSVDGRFIERQPKNTKEKVFLLLRSLVYV